jgi:hypothetical protein
MKSVEEGSATLNARIEYPVHLDNKSHLTMCKFQDNNEPGFRRLLSRIKAEIEEFEDPSTSPRRGVTMDFAAPLAISKQGTQRQLQEMRDQMARDATGLEEGTLYLVKLYWGVGLFKNCRPNWTLLAERNAEAQLKLKRKIKKWLRPPDTKEIPYKADLAAKSAAVEGTCTWLLSHPDYQRWRSSEHSVLAWLHGIQGSGKSTLIAYTINQLHAEGLRIAYLFCHQDADVSPAILINCLTLQMLKQDSKVLNALKPIYEKTVGASLVFLQTATTVFKAALKAFGECFIIIDALDECHLEDRQALLKILLDSVAETSSGLKILCSSKNEPDLDQVILRHQHAIEIAMTSDDIDEDVEKMIRVNIDKTLFLSQRLASAPPHYFNYVVDTLRNGAQGMFLLPKYMVEDLNSKGSIAEISAFLLDLPLGFARILPPTSRTNGLAVASNG